MTVFGIPDQLAVGWKLLPASGANQFAYSITAFQVAEPCFLTHIGARLRKNGSSNGNIQFSVWQEQPDTPLPDDRLCFTQQVTVTESSSSTGGPHEMPVYSSDRDLLIGTSGAAVPLFPGITYYLGGDVQGASLQIGTIAGIATIFQRNISGGNPTDPFGAGTPTTDASPAIPILWFKADTDAPITVTMTGPATSVNTITPTITGTITQTDTGTPYFDRLGKYEIAVRDAITTGQKWGAVFTANSAEVLANAFSVVYAGSALVPGGQYEVQARAAGVLGVFGAWSAWRPFTIGAVGAIDVTVPTPSGKQPDGVIDTMVGKWTHPTIGTAMAKVNVQILSNGEPARSSLTLHPTGITKSAAYGATFSVSAAEHGMTPVTDPLPPGNYTYQMQGIDTGGGQTPWSAEAPFSVNWEPNVPTNTRPSSGVNVTTPPRLRWDGSDPDPDDIFGGNVVSYVTITNLATNISTTYGPINDIETATGAGYLDTVLGVHLSGDGVYQWSVYLSDGLATGKPSTPSLFTLIAAPTLTINTPNEGDTVTSSAPSITFTIGSSSIASYYAEFSRPGETHPFRVSSIFTVDPPATSQTYQPIPGWLENGQYYDVEIVSTTPVNIVSRSGKRRFRVQYTNAPGLVEVDAGLQFNSRDWEATSVALRWAMSGLVGPEFAGYVVWLRESSEPASAAVPIKIITSAGSTGWVHHHPPPNTRLTYGVSQLQRVLGDIRASTPVEIEIDTPLVVPVLVSWTDPIALRAPIVWLSTGLGFGFDRNDATLETWGSEGAPLYVRNPANYGAESFPISFTIRNDSYGTLRQHLLAWRAMVKSGDVFSFRTEIGRTWVKINAKGSWATRSGVGTYKISISLQEVFHPEIVSIEV